MQDGGLFSFQGRIGRGRLWLILIVAGLLAPILDLSIPVSGQTIKLSSFSSITYPTAERWDTLVLYCAIVFSIYWIVIAAFVKRLHDLDKSGKWLALFPAMMLLSFGVDASLSKFGLQQSTIDLVVTLLAIPFILLLIWGAFQTLLLPSDNHSTAKTQHFE